MTYTKESFFNETEALAGTIIDYAMQEGREYNISDVKVSMSVAQKQKNVVENGELSTVSGGESLGVSVTLFSGDKIMSFLKNTFDFTKIKESVDDALKVIHLVPENPYKRLLESDKVYSGKKDDLDLYDDTQISQDDLINYAKEMNKAALSYPNIKSSRDTSITRNVAYYFAKATNGFENRGSRTTYAASVSAIAEDKNEMQVNYDYSHARYFSDLEDPRELGVNSAKGAVAKLSASLPKSGESSIVLSHDAAESFFSSIYKAIDGSAVYTGKTFLKDKLGELVMSPSITVVDNPRVKRGLQSSYVDSSGMESKKITFVEKGVLKSYNVSLEEARQLGIEPIGRNDSSTNTSILPSDKTREELVADIVEGVYIEDFKGGEVNVVNGIHSREAYGFKIKDGKITDEAVDGFVVVGKLQEMFMNVSIANDTPKHPSTKYQIAAPTTRIDKVIISSGL